MKKTPIILFLILIIGLGAAFFYQVPETKTYTGLNNIDNKIEQTLTINEATMSQTLTALQQSVESLIELGETYTEETNVKDAFDSFHHAYQEAQQLQAQLTELTNEDFLSSLEGTTKKLSDEQKALAEEAITLQTARLETLNVLNDEVVEINTRLELIEELFYDTKPSDAVQYFNTINNQFLAVKKAHNDYTEATINYLTAKSALYNAITK